MNQFTQLVDDTADEQKHSLSSILLRSQLLAGKMKSESLREWIRHEIGGYASDHDLPQYRKIKPHYIATLAGEFSRLDNVPISILGLPDDWQEMLREKHLKQPISALEQMASSGNEMLYNHFDASMLSIFRRYPPVSADGMVINGVSQCVLVASIRGVLHSIRARLLDYLIELQHAHPELTTDADAAQHGLSGDADRLVNQVIYQLHGGISMDSYYSSGQAGAIGPHSHAHDMTFNQIWNEHKGEIDLTQLSGELATLRTAAQKEPSSIERDIAIGEIAKAEQAANSGDGSKAMEHLKNAGVWTLDFAKKVAVPLTAYALKGLIFGDWAPT